MIAGLFATPIYFNDLTLDNQNLIIDIKKIQQADPGVKKSNVNGWHSGADINILMLPEFENVQKAIFDSAKLALLEMGYSNVGLVLLNSWSIITPKGGSNTIHNHSNSFLSGVYYIQVDTESSPLNFYDPRDIKVFLNPFNSAKNGTYTADVVNFKVKSGKLLIFPSWLKHSVPENKSETDRIIISFNLGIIK